MANCAAALDIVTLKFADGKWPAPSFSCTLKLYVPAVVGVPLRTPPERLKPGGSTPVLDRNVARSNPSRPWETVRLNSLGK